MRRLNSLNYERQCNVQFNQAMAPHCNGHILKPCNQNHVYQLTTMKVFTSPGRQADEADFRWISYDIFLSL